MDGANKMHCYWLIGLPLPLVVVFGIALRQFVSGLTAGALKG